MDRKIGVGLPNGTDETSRYSSISASVIPDTNGTHSQFSSLWLQETSHVLHTEDVDAFVDELVDEVKIVLESIFGLLGAGNISAIANDGLNHSTSLLGGIDTELQL